MSRSAFANADGISKIIIGMMIKDNCFIHRYSAAIKTASAIISPIIPTLIPMLLYVFSIRNINWGIIFSKNIPRYANGINYNHHEYDYFKEKEV